jgi:hypothetical protein
LVTPLPFFHGIDLYCCGEIISVVKEWLKIYYLDIGITEGTYLKRLAHCTILIVKNTMDIS